MSNARGVVLRFLTFVLLLLCAGAALAQNATVPRPEYPRPDLARADWQTLNGRWEFEFDDANRGLAEGWHRDAGRRFTRTIQVPYAYQARLSGINDPSFH